jgi:formylglycine-generating enzyme required for sulfatase activity
MGEIATPVGTYSDVYSFGLTMNMVLFQRLHPTPRMIREYPDQELMDILSECEEQEPQQRIQDFGAVLDRLGKLGSGRKRRQAEEKARREEEEKQRLQKKKELEDLEKQIQSRKEEAERIEREEQQKRAAAEALRKKQAEEDLQRRQAEEDERKRRQAEEARRKKSSVKVPSGFTFLREAKYTCGGITNTVQEFQHDVTGMEFVYIPGGTFQMGGDKNDDEKPIHKVTLKPYLIGKYAVTQAEWKKIMGSDPSNFKGDRRPVEQVSWKDCQEFCKKTGLALPSEAQWEFACRAGSTGEYCFGDDESLLEQYAWYDKNSGSETHPVGEKKPNARGLYDMHGNVWEWCQDGWHDNYQGAPGDASAWETGTSAGSLRVFRGGFWYFVALWLRSADRGRYDAEGRYDYLGARLVSEAH